MKSLPCWPQHFAEMDRLYEAACEVESAIEDSIGAEQYAEATRLRESYAEIQERDEVNTVLKVTSGLSMGSSCDQEGIVIVHRSEVFGGLCSL